MLRLFLPVLLLVAAALADARVDFEARVSEFRLANGLHAIIYVDSSSPVVTVATAYDVGPVQEPPGQTGLSHMVEHMTFQRSDRYKPAEMFRKVKAAGGMMNGFTSTFYTAYYQVYSRDRWEQGLELEASRMARVIISDSDFATEHGVVAEERRLRDNRPQYVFSEQLEAQFFLAHPQRNPGIGWSDDVARFTAAAVRDWYTRWYNPANAVIIAAGDVRPDDARARIERHFGRLKGHLVTHPDFSRIEPEQLGERRFVSRQKVRVASYRVGWHIPAPSDSLYPAAVMLSGALGSGRSSRLYRLLVVDSALATQASCYAGAERDPGSFWISIVPRNDSLIPRIERLVLGEVERLRRELLTERELRRVKNSTLAERIFEQDEVLWTAIGLARSQIVEGSWRYELDFRERIEQVTAEQVRAFAREWLKPNQATVGILMPEVKK